jgi:hypothetical protein
MKRILVLAVVLHAALGVCAFAEEKDRGEDKEKVLLKDRSAIPAVSDIDLAASLDSLLEKTGPTAWSEKKAARIEGYVMQVEREEDGDVHVVVAPSLTDTDSKRWFIAEITTPARKRMNISLDKIRSYRGQKVRLTGWLYHEPDVPSPDPRGTLWELHPVTSIELLK